MEKDVDKLLSGGVPFAGVGNWLDGKIKKQDAVFEKILTLLNEDIDGFIFEKTVDVLTDCFKDIDIFYVSSEKFSEKLRRGILEASLRIIYKKIIKIQKPTLIISHAYFGVFYAIFVRNDSISDEKFEILLKKFQNVYNLLLAGYSKKQIIELFDKDERVYTPTKSYPTYYNCIHSSIAECIRYNFPDIVIFDSLLTVEDLFCVPSYRVLGDNLRSNCGLQLENKNIDLGIFTIKKGEFADFVEAKKFFKKRAGNSPVMLMGSPFFVQSLGEARKAFSRGIRFGNKHISIFSGTCEKPILHESVGFYFGRMSIDNFRKYWEECDDIENSCNEKKYIVIEVENVRSHEYKMLLAAMKENVDIFFERKKLSFEEDKRVFATVLGRKALELFLLDVEKNQKRSANAISDVTIMDMLMRFRRSALFLRDFLRDIFESGDASECVMDAEDIVNQYALIVEICTEAINNKGIEYYFFGSVVPSKEMHVKKFLSGDDKREVMEKLKVINRKYIRLFNKLDKL